MNCPAIPGTLLESELFGYQRGAFTGAFGTKAGRVEMAESGTLFLDEISELDLSLQSKLLQVLQDGQFQAIGSTIEKKVNIRVICATNRQLHGRSRKSASARTFTTASPGLVLRLPPLRDRLQDFVRWGILCGAAQRTVQVRRAADFRIQSFVNVHPSVDRQHTGAGKPDETVRGGGHRGGDLERDWAARVCAARFPVTRQSNPTFRSLWAS